VTVSAATAAHAGRLRFVGRLGELRVERDGRPAALAALRFEADAVGVREFRGGVVLATPFALVAAPALPVLAPVAWVWSR
jgi:hypothetical protein